MFPRKSLKINSILTIESLLGDLLQRFTLLYTWARGRARGRTRTHMRTRAKLIYRTGVAQEEKRKRLCIAFQ